MELKYEVNHRKGFSRVGLAVFMAGVLARGVTSVMAIAILGINENLLKNPWVSVALQTIGIDVVGIIVWILMLKKLPTGEKRESKKLSIGNIIKLCFIILAAGFGIGIIYDCIVNLL